jgi:PAS domain S-box-containing protein
VAWLRDVTAQKRAEAALIEERHLLHTLMDNLPDHIYFKDLQSRFIRINKAMVKWFGLSDPALAVGKTDFDFFSDEHARQAYADEQEVIRTGRPIQAIEEKETWPDGHETWVSTTKMPLRDAQERIIGTFGVSRDITERKQAEEAQRESEEKYHRLFSNALDAILIFDTEAHRFIDANEAASQLYSYAHEELVGMRPENLSAEPEQTTAAIQEAERTGSIRVPLRWHRKKDGTVFPIEYTACPFVWKDRKVLSVFVRDITERKRAEAELADRLRFETLLADLSARFVNVPAERLDGEIEEAQRRVGECLGVEASSLWQASAETPRSVLRLTQVYRPLGGPPLPERIDAREYFPWCYQQMVDLKAKVIAVSSLEELPAEAARDREAWRQLGVKSALVIPLSVGGGTPVGALSFNTMVAERTWSEETVNRLQLVAEMLSNALARQHSDRALRESEGRYRTLFENAPVGIYRSTPDGRLLIANPRFVRMLGYSSFEELAASDLNVETCHHEYARTRFQELVERPGGVTGLESKWRRRDGSIIYILENARVVRDDSGKVLYYEGTVEDITGRKEAEEALRGSEQNYRELADSIADVFFATDNDLKYTYWNKASEDLTGIPAKDAIGKSLHQLFPNIGGTHWEKLYLEALGTGQPRRLIDEYEIKGQRKTFEINVYPSRNGLSVFARDVTERKRAELALQASEERYRAFLANSSEGIWRYEGDQPISTGLPVEEQMAQLLQYAYLAECNDALARMYGFERAEEMMGRRLKDRVAEDPRITDYLRAFIQSGYRIENAETVGRDREGKLRHFLNSYVGVVENGYLVRAWGVQRDITERKRTEEALRESEERYRGLFENSLEGIGLSKGNKVINANRALLDIFGYSDLEEFKALPLLEHVAPQSRDLIKEIWEKQDRGGPYPHRFEYQIIRKNGEVRSLEISRDVVCIGSQRYTQSTFRDITDRKRAEEALRAAEEKFRKAFDACPEPMAIRTFPEGRYLEANNAFARLAGCSREEIIGKTVTELEIYVNRELLDRMNALIVQDGKVHDYEASLGWKSRELIHALVSAERIELSGLPCLLVVAKDITERKRAEEELLFKTALLEAESETTIDGILVVGRGDQVLLANRRFSEMWNIPADLIRANDGKKLRQYVRTQLKDPDAFLERLDYLYSHETERSRDEIAFKDGRVYDRYSSPLHAASGEYYGRIWYFRDITERKRAEEERVRSLEQLRALAARLQSIREEERTRVSREIHDQLGQALTAIKLDLTSLARDFTAEQNQQWKRASSILGLVDQTIQSVRRISTALRPGMLDDLGLVATVEWAAGEFETRTGTKCLLDVPEEHITLDPETATAVFRIFQETLTNVARHANASEVKVRLAKQDGDLTLEVHDNGGGITEDEISSAGSLGILGMRERAFLLGGEVTVSGEPGKGTTVRVRIPAAYRAEQE